LSCASSLVQHNTIVDATDGGELVPLLPASETETEPDLVTGIVVFGSPYSVIHNNTIHVQTVGLLPAFSDILQAVWFVLILTADAPWWNQQ
jgi:hypothetical protein